MTQITNNTREQAMMMQYLSDLALAKSFTRVVLDLLKGV